MVFNHIDVSEIKFIDTIHAQLSGWGQGGGNLGVQGAGSLQEAVEERAGSGIYPRVQSPMVSGRREEGNVAGTGRNRRDFASLHNILQ